MKLVDKFTYPRNSVSSTENDTNMWQAKACTAIDRISVIWKSVLSDEIKFIFLSCGWVHTTIWMHHMDADLAYREKSNREVYKNATSYTEKILEATSNKTAAVRETTSHLYNHPNKTNKACEKLLEVYSCGPLHTNK